MVLTSSSKFKKERGHEVEKESMLGQLQEVRGGEEWRVDMNIFHHIHVWNS